MDGIKSFEDKVYNSRAEYDEDVIKIEELFTPLVLKCKENNRAMRIGYLILEINMRKWRDICIYTFLHI